MTKEIIPSTPRGLEKYQRAEEKNLTLYKKILNKVTNIFFEPEGINEIYEKFKEVDKSIQQPKNKKEEDLAWKKLSKINQRAVSLKLYPWGNLSTWSIDDENTLIVKQMRNSFIKEYCPSTPTELSLIDIIATAYYSLMRNSRILNFILMRKEEDNKIYVSFEPNQMKTAKEAAKAMELAYRQFTTSLIMLKEMKQPKLNINVKTEGTYFARNQQIINIKKSRVKKEKQRVRKIINNK